MIELTVKCEDCVHQHVCRYVNRPSEIVNQIENSNIAEEADACVVEIEVRCRNYIVRGRCL